MFPALEMLPKWTWQKTHIQKQIVAYNKKKENQK